MEKKELAARGITREECLATWSGADLAFLCNNVCLVGLFIIEYLLKCLLNWILKRRATSYFWGAHGEMLLTSEPSLIHRKILQIIVRLSQSKSKVPVSFVWSTKEP